MRKIEAYRKITRGDKQVILSTSHFVQNPRIFNAGYSVRKTEAYRKKIIGDNLMQVIKRKMYSTKAFLLQTINPWFITGFIDAEASFIISITKNPKTTSRLWN